MTHSRKDLDLLRKDLRQKLVEHTLYAAGRQLEGFVDIHSAGLNNDSSRSYLQVPHTIRTAYLREIGKLADNMLSRPEPSLPVTLISDENFAKVSEALNVIYSIEQYANTVFGIINSNHLTLRDCQLSGSQRHRKAAIVGSSVLAFVFASAAIPAGMFGGPALAFPAIAACGAAASAVRHSSDAVKLHNRIKAGAMQLDASGLEKIASINPSTITTQITDDLKNIVLASGDTVRSLSSGVTALPELMFSDVHSEPEVLEETTPLIGRK